MTKERIEKAIEVIDYAIKNQISVKEASVKCGYANTYVKNIKAVVFEKYENGSLDDELFELFNESYERYSISRNEKIREKTPNENTGSQTTTIVDDQKGEMNIEWKSGSDSYPSNHVKTLKDLLNESETDLNIWRVKDHIINKWDVTSWKSGNAKTVQNWQVKARLVKDMKMSDMEDIEKIFKDMVENYQPPVFDFYENNDQKEIDFSDPTENNLFEISIFDLHIGKLAWGGETFENYDTKIARKRFMQAIRNLLKNASGYNYNRILFPIGNDFFNSDTIFNTTTKGTQQDEDLRWQKTFDIGVRLIVDGIYMLKQIGVPIDVVVIPGNHDYERSYYLGKYLEAWFNNDDVVNINNSASPRKYYRFGNLLLGLTHGSEEKENSLPMLMATDIESKPMWSETKFHEWHVGHIHRKRTVKFDLNKTRELNEDLGVTIRYLSSLTGTEEWHHKKGFVGSIKAADGFIWNYENGLMAHLNTNIKID